MPTSAPVTKVTPSSVIRSSTALDDLLLQLHVGDTVHQQTADAVGALKDGDAVAPVVELVSHSQTGGAAAHHGHPLAGAHLGDAGAA